MWSGVNLLVSVVVTTVLFALLYRFLPDVQLRWRDVTTGAFVTAVLFTIGQQLIGLYLGQSSVASTYGAAGSVMILLLWVDYSCQILLLGAEFTRVYAQRTGRRPQPESFAERIRTREASLRARHFLLCDAALHGAAARGEDPASDPRRQPAVWSTCMVFFQAVAAPDPEIALNRDGTLDQSRYRFNTEGFVIAAAAQPAPFQKRQFPFRIDGVRGPGLFLVNANVVRNFRSAAGGRFSSAWTCRTCSTRCSGITRN